MSGPMKLQFSHQDHQHQAVQAVVQVFDGQPMAKSEFSLVGTAASVHYAHDGSIGNTLVLSDAQLLENVRAVQQAQGMAPSDALIASVSDAPAPPGAGPTVFCPLNFSIEMETGTGKTYAFIKTMYELNRVYGFKKFVVVVPSVAIREGTMKNLAITRSHFAADYAQVPCVHILYDSGRLTDLRHFAQSDALSVLVINIDSFAKDSNRIKQKGERAFAPIEYIRAVNTIVIIDEPQNFETDVRRSALMDLNPLCTLRYSATHKDPYNLLYSLNPVQAYDLGLVKQIEVDGVLADADRNQAFVELLSIDAKAKGMTAKVRLDVNDKTGPKRKELTLKLGEDLFKKSVGRDVYQDGYILNEIRADEGEIEFSGGRVLRVSQAQGGLADDVMKFQIERTVAAHFAKLKNVQPIGVKVLSLFFIDKVANYRAFDEEGNRVAGKFEVWFEEAFNKYASMPKYRGLIPHAASDVHDGYFSGDKKGKGAKAKTVWVDTSGSVAKDDSTYQLIMKDKERLLSADEPLQFIFSHSALREGWDNPNVFQICTLNETKSAMKKRQTIGRGLRLPVTKTDKGYERVADRGIATLTVIANESYTAFAKSLQNEYKSAGVEIGRVRVNEFAKIAARDANGNMTEATLGYAKSKEIYDHLTQSGFLKDGMVTSKFLPNTLDFSLNLPVFFTDCEQEIIEAVMRASLERYVKPRSIRKERILNKDLYLTPEFEKFWDAISPKTTYRVSVSRNDLVTSSIKAIKDLPRIDPLRIKITRAGVKVLRGGATGEELATRSAELKGSYDLPDIVTELQEATSLTRRTIVDVLIGSGRLSEFIGNPNDFIDMVKRALQGELAKLVVEGIQYEKIAGSVYELRELQKDGAEEKERFLNQMYLVKNRQKTDFDYVVYDSDVERKFAEMLDSREDIKLFMKLPAKFKIDTPVGPYNPDWAIIKQEDGEDRIYMIRETKSTLDDSKLRPSELAKIRSAKEHFKAIGITNYGRSVPEKWNL